MSSVFDKPAGPRRVLAIDGGGMRGALAVGLLAQLEATLRTKLGRPNLVLADYFDLIGGTSTGAIIAAGLALGRDTDYLAALYHRLGPIVFGKKGFRVPMVQSRFDPKRLEDVIVEELGHVTLGDAPWRSGFAAVAKRVDTGSCWVLTNCPYAAYWNGDPNWPDVTPNRDYSLAKIVQASAAAPFYFDMVDLEVMKGESGVFFDGAMTPHGNPALQLAMTSLIPAYGLGTASCTDGKRKGWEPGADRLMIVSVGTGQARPTKPEWAGRPMLLSIWKAIHALTSLAYDNSQLGVSILQWLGNSPQRWRINSEVEGLANSLPGCDALWTFVRYDAPLQADWLRNTLHEDFTPDHIARLQKMDDDSMVPELFRVGQKAGEALIRPEHFPDAFDPVAP